MNDDGPDYDEQFFTPQGPFAVRPIEAPALTTALVHEEPVEIGLVTYRRWRTYFGVGGTAAATIYLQRLVKPVD